MIRFPDLTRLLAAALVALALPPAALAQERFPSRAVTILVGFAAGGGGDISARWIAEFLRERWKVPVVVENRPGAGATIAAAARREADEDRDLARREALLREGRAGQREHGEQRDDGCEQAGGNGESDHGGLLVSVQGVQLSAQRLELRRVAGGIDAHVDERWALRGECLAQRAPVRGHARDAPAAPAGVPADVVARWEEAAQEMVKSSAFRELMGKLNATLSYQGSAEFSASITGVHRQMGRLIPELGFKQP